MGSPVLWVRAHPSDPSLTVMEDAVSKWRSWSRVWDYFSISGQGTHSTIYGPQHNLLSEGTWTEAGPRLRVVLGPMAGKEQD